MKKLIIFILVFIFYYAHAQEEIVEKFETYTHQHSDNTLSYRMFIPESYDTSYQYPLILALHGAGERGNDNISHIEVHRLATSWADPINQAKYPCIVVAPQCPFGEYWNEPYLISFLHDLVMTLADTMSVDANRLYITGLSMGGYGTWAMIQTYPDVFAAAIPMSGGGDASDVSMLNMIPIWNWHGGADNVVPASRSMEMMEALEQNGRHVVYTHCQYRKCYTMPDDKLQNLVESHIDQLYTEYKGLGHVMWAQSYDHPLLFPWVFSKYKYQMDALVLNDIDIANPVHDSLTVSWQSINPEDSILIYYSPDDENYWYYIDKGVFPEGEYSIRTADIVDGPAGVIKVFLKNNKGFIYAYDQISNLHIDNISENGVPVIQIINDVFYKKSSISSEGFELVLKIMDAEADPLDLNIFYSLDDGDNYELLHTETVYPALEARSYPVALDELEYSNRAKFKVQIMDGDYTVEDSTWYFTNADGYKPSSISRSESGTNEMGIKNYPNPFVEKTLFDVNIPLSGQVKLTIYDEPGQKVHEIIYGYMERGHYTLSYTKKEGMKGLYYYRLVAGNYISRGKMIITE